MLLPKASSILWKRNSPITVNSKPKPKPKRRFFEYIEVFITEPEFILQIIICHPKTTKWYKNLLSNVSGLMLTDHLRVGPIRRSIWPPYYLRCQTLNRVPQNHQNTEFETALPPDRVPVQSRLRKRLRIETRKLHIRDFLLKTGSTELLHVTWCPATK